jgi:hypothetical protein
MEELDDEEMEQMLAQMKAEKKSVRRSILGEDLKDNIARIEETKNNNLMRSIVQHGH